MQVSEWSITILSFPWRRRSITFCKSPESDSVNTFSSQVWYKYIYQPIKSEYNIIQLVYIVAFLNAVQLISTTKFLTSLLTFSEFSLAATEAICNIVFFVIGYSSVASPTIQSCHFCFKFIIIIHFF